MHPVFLREKVSSLVTEGAEKCVAELRQYFHPSVQVSLWDGKGSVEEVAKYLSVHGKRAKIVQWRTVFGSEK